MVRFISVKNRVFKIPGWALNYEVMNQGISVGGI